MGAIKAMIAYYIFGGLVLLFFTYGCVSVYALLWWDWDAVWNLHHWLNPANNIMVRIGMFVGGILSFFGGIAADALEEVK